MWGREEVAPTDEWLQCFLSCSFHQSRNRVLDLFPFVSCAQISAWNPNLVSLGLTQRACVAGWFRSPCLSLQAGSFRNRKIPALSSVLGAPLELPLQDLLCAGISTCLRLNETPSWLQSPGRGSPGQWTGRKAQWRVGGCCQGQGYHRLVGLPSPGG